MFSSEQLNKRSVDRDAFMALKERDLVSFLSDMDRLSSGQKSAYAMSLIRSSNIHVLSQLKCKINEINDLPADKSFLFRLLQAVEMREYILQFENLNYDRLQLFTTLSDDVLMRYSGLLQELSQEGAEALACRLQTTMPQYLLSFTGVLQRMMSCVRTTAALPAILVAFEKHAMILNERDMQDYETQEALLRLHAKASATRSPKEGDSTLSFSSDSHDVIKDRVTFVSSLSSSRDSLFGLASETFDNDDTFTAAVVAPTGPKK